MAHGKIITQTIMQGHTTAGQKNYHESIFKRTDGNHVSAC